MLGRGQFKRRYHKYFWNPIEVRAFEELGLVKVRQLLSDMVFGEIDVVDGGNIVAGKKEKDHTISWDISQKALLACLRVRPYNDKRRRAVYTENLEFDVAYFRFESRTRPTGLWGGRPTFPPPVSHFL